MYNIAGCMSIYPHDVIFGSYDSKCLTHIGVIHIPRLFLASKPNNFLCVSSRHSCFADVEYKSHLQSPRFPAEVSQMTCPKKKCASLN